VPRTIASSCQSPPYLFARHTKLAAKDIIDF
jgi:hypothetical protein